MGTEVRPMPTRPSPASLPLRFAHVRRTRERSMRTAAVTPEVPAWLRGNLPAALPRTIVPQTRRRQRAWSSEGAVSQAPAPLPPAQLPPEIGRYGSASGQAQWLDFLPRPSRTCLPHHSPAIARACCRYPALSEVHYERPSDPSEGSWTSTKPG